MRPPIAAGLRNMGIQTITQRSLHRPPGPFPKNEMPALRNAVVQDVPAILALINGYAAKRILLPRSHAELSENIGEFIVAEEYDTIIACGALKVYDNDIGEIRSLCVEPHRKISGLGRAITLRLLRKAEGRKLKTVFALTVAPEFFWKCGFHEAPRENFPLKIWRDCLLCPKFSCCDEKTMAIDVTRTRP
jgi:amino-acid N-acetyltransferase